MHWSKALHSRLKSSGKLEPLTDVMTIIPNLLTAAKLHGPFSQKELWEMDVSCCVWCNDLTILLASLFFSLRVAVVSKSFEGQTDRTEEWYGTQYKQEAITDEAIKVRHIWFHQMFDFVCSFLFQVHIQTLSSFSFRILTSGEWSGWVTKKVVGAIHVLWALYVWSKGTG